jgi:hypothetical protein
VTEREAPPNPGFDYPQSDPFENDGWFGGEHVTQPTFVDEVLAPRQTDPITSVQENRYEPAPERDPAPTTRPPSTPTVNTWTVNGQLRAPDSSTLTFRAPPPP